MQEEEDVDQEIRQVTGGAGEEPGEGLEEVAPPSSSQHHSGTTQHTDLVHPNIVLKVLRAFVEDNKHPPK